LPKSNAQAFIGLFFAVSMHFSCCVFVMLPNLTFMTVALIFIYRIIWAIVKKGHKAVAAKTLAPETRDIYLQLEIENIAFF